MEYASHGELFEYIVANKRCDEATALHFYKQIIAGISYLHSLNIIHRDLKPENLLLDHENNIKIVDFGLSNKGGEHDLLKTACGSPCYAPPEMVLGKRYKGSPADVWSSGVVLYALLCGYLPFDDPNTTKLYKKITIADYTVPPYVSQQAKDLISKILCIDPSKRYTISDIMNHPWFKSDSPNIILEPGIKLGSDSIPVDLDTIKIISAKYSIDEEKIMILIRGNRHCLITAVYYLLLASKTNGNPINDLIEVTSLAEKIDKDESFIFEKTPFYKEKMETKGKYMPAPASARLKPLHGDDTSESRNQAKGLAKQKPEESDSKRTSVKRNSVKTSDIEAITKKALAATIVAPPSELLVKRQPEKPKKDLKIMKSKGLNLSVALPANKKTDLSINENSTKNAATKIPHAFITPKKIAPTALKLPMQQKLNASLIARPSTSTKNSTNTNKSINQVTRPKTASKRYDQLRCILQGI